MTIVLFLLSLMILFDVFVVVVESFQPVSTVKLQQQHRRSAKQQQQHSPRTTTTTTSTTTILFSSFSPTRHSHYHPSNNNNNNNKEEAWSLQDDWLLQDQVPKFTVGDVTFWDQLIAATPSLSRRHDKEFLWNKCQELNITMAGPSPPILQQWSIDAHGRVTGITAEGRTIWVTCHVIGRLEGDPLSVLDMYAFGGGYVEAIGGRVYELGWPSSSSQPKIIKSVTTTPPLPFQEKHTNVRMEQDDTDSKKGKLDWWIPPVTATVSALIASTFLSACIGYAAGTSIIAHRDSSNSYYQNGYSTTTTTPTETSLLLLEQRTQVQQRIIREQRALETISEKLQQDQAQLQNLIKLQQQQQQLLP